MKKYTFSSLLFYGLVASSPAQALIFDGNLIEPNYQNTTVLLWEPTIGVECTYNVGCEQVVNGREARIVLEYRTSRSHEKVYRVILDAKDTWKKVLSDLHLVRSEATLEKLVNENKLKDGKLPVSIPGATATITYTVPNLN